jgi:hypothetical protein
MNQESLYVMIDHPSITECESHTGVCMNTCSLCTTWYLLVERFVSTLRKCTNSVSPLCILLFKVDPTVVNAARSSANQRIMTREEHLASFNVIK